LLDGHPDPQLGPHWVVYGGSELHSEFLQEDGGEGLGGLSCIRREARSALEASTDEFGMEPPSTFVMVDSFGVAVGQKVSRGHVKGVVTGELVGLRTSGECGLRPA